LSDMQSYGLLIIAIDNVPIIVHTILKDSSLLSTKHGSIGMEYEIFDKVQKVFMMNAIRAIVVTEVS